MDIYIIINLLLLIFAVVNYRNGKARKLNEIGTLSFVFFSVFLILFVGLRDCGFDYENYFFRSNAIYTSNNWLDTSLTLGIEPGFGLLSKIFEFRELLIVVAFLTIAIMAYFLYKYSPYPFISLFLYLPNLYLGAMGQIRQALAISIVMIAFIYIQKKKKFIVLILIASSFHATALAGFLFLFIPQTLKSMRFYFVLLGSSFVLNLFCEYFLGYLLPFLPYFISSKIDFYINIYDVRYEGMNIGLNAATLLRVVILLVGLYLKDNFKKIPYLTWFYNIYFLGTCLYIGLGFLPTFATRVSYTFTILDIVLLPMLLACSVGKRKLIVLSLIIFMIINRQVPFLNEESEYYPEYVPYRMESIF